MRLIRRSLAVLLSLLTMSLLGPVAVAQAAPTYSPVGALDPLAFFPDDSVVVYGWAADPEGITQALDVHVYVDGVRGYVLRTGTKDRPDVTAATGAPNAGMVGVLPPQGPGRHEVCAYAINIGPTGSNTLIGCRQYGAPVTSYAPTGAVEPLAFFPDGSPVVYGWAADRNQIAQPLDVHIWVDGVRSYVTRTGNHPRPDVAAAVGAPNAGFVAVLPPQGAGQHTVCAYAINIGPVGPNPLLGCRTYGQATAPPPAPAPGNPGDTRNCGDFPTQAAAQAWFNTYYPLYGDVAGLDEDNDRIACEFLP